MTDVEFLTSHAWMLALVWLPFAIGAGLVDGWQSETFRRWRDAAVHPFRAARDWRVTHTHTHAPAH